ncbi:MAG: CoA pyrophosphatase [Actinobacteria bacterium]|nr:CoA pyrophosphatase [Actinomycetota bacterium]
MSEADPFAQPIPRPPGARRGGLPPWASAAGAPGRPRVTAAEVREAVVDHPDLPVVAPDVVPASAVLVAVWDEGGEARILLTRRTAWLRSHSGQVAFPGGRVEPGETLVGAALREAEEEVGLDRASVEVVGRLSRLFTISSGAGIYPVVGILPGRPSLAPNPAEVDRVFDVALGELMGEGIFHEEVWSLTAPVAREVGSEEGDRSVYFFDVAGETVWGATARVLHELLCLIVGRGPV